MEGGRPSDAVTLSDYGTKVGIKNFASVNVPMNVADASRAFVKFQGDSNKRVSLSTLTADEVESSGCHWVVCYSSNKGHPRQVKDGDTVFMGRFTKSPNDIRIFGWAKGIAHVDGRDDATPEEIRRRPWKKEYSRYIRVHSAKFVDGTFANGVSLNELIDTLGVNSYEPSQRRAQQGEDNVNPRRSHSQQGAVELIAEAHMWLAERLQSAFDIHGAIPQKNLNELDWPSQDDLSYGA